MPRVFLSYRRCDTAAEAGRLADSLRQQLGSRWVFRDVVSISLGSEFDAVLEKELAAANTVLVLIGPSWLSELEKRAERREVDYVRSELRAALSGKGKRIIPVLLRDATLPAEKALPSDLATLLKRQAITLRDESWGQDVKRLIEAIGRPYRWDLAAVRAVAAIVVAIVAVKVLAPQLAPDRLSDYAFLRLVVACLIGLYALIEIGMGYLHFKKSRLD